MIKEIQTGLFVSFVCEETRRMFPNIFREIDSNSNNGGLSKFSIANSNLHF